MSNSILYYPTIEFQKADYRWLWSASLFWDKIYRIVPPGYEFSEPSNIRALCDSGDIGIPISPEIYANKIADEFLPFIDEHKINVAALNDICDEDCNEYIRVHQTKMDVKLRSKLLYHVTNENHGNEWLYLKPETANFYMTYLANRIAKENSLSLYTGSRELWTASTFFLFDGRVQPYYLPGKDYVEPSFEALVSMMIPDVYPVNILDISPDDILKFREKRKDERAEFMEAINNFRMRLSSATAPEVLNEIVNNEQQKVKTAVDNYKKSMDILKVVKFGGVLTTLLTIAADALGYLPFPQTVKSIVASSGLGVEVLTGLFEGRQKHTDNPYTYLAKINSNFSFHPSTIRDCPNMPMLSKYNYSLYRDFEEFIND